MQILAVSFFLMLSSALALQSYFWRKMEFKGGKPDCIMAAFDYDVAKNNFTSFGCVVRLWNNSVDLPGFLYVNKDHNAFEHTTKTTSIHYHDKDPKDAYVCA